MKTGYKSLLYCSNFNIAVFGRKHKGLVFPIEILPLGPDSNSYGKH